MPDFSLMLSLMHRLGPSICLVRDKVVLSHRVGQTPLWVCCKHLEIALFAKTGGAQEQQAN